MGTQRPFPHGKSYFAKLQSCQRGDGGVVRCDVSGISPDRPQVSPGTPIVHHHRRGPVRSDERGRAGVETSPNASVASSASMTPVAPMSMSPETRQYFRWRAANGRPPLTPTEPARHGRLAKEIDFAAEDGGHAAVASRIEQGGAGTRGRAEGAGVSARQVSSRSASPSAAHCVEAMESEEDAEVARITRCARATDPNSEEEVIMNCAARVEAMPGVHGRTPVRLLPRSTTRTFPERPSSGVATELYAREAEEGNMPSPNVISLGFPQLSRGTPSRLAPHRTRGGQQNGAVVPLPAVKTPSRAVRPSSRLSVGVGQSPHLPTSTPSPLAGRTFSRDVVQYPALYLVGGKSPMLARPSTAQPVF